MIKVDARNIVVPVPEDLPVEAAVAVVEAAGQVAITSIKARVRRGIGSDDRKMKSKAKETNEAGTYGLYYSKKRQQQGRNVNIRDLTNTGRMLQGVIVDRVDVSPTGATAVVTVENSQKEKAAYNEAITPWFELSPSDQRNVEEAAIAALQRMLGL